jgi:methyl-accepting chemotaxis protein
MQVIAVVMLLSLFVAIYFIVQKAVKQRLESFKFHLNRFLNYINFKTNTFDKINISKMDEIGDLMHDINKTSDEFKEKIYEDTRVAGEIVLTLSKVKQGIYGCRVTSHTDNPMLETLKNTINSMLNTVDKNMSTLKETLESYTAEDYRPEITIDPKLKAEMRSILESVNKLGEALSHGARENLENGKILEKNAMTMSASVSNVAHKANEQAASLEETAAAVEEITSITRNNAENSAKMANLGSVVKNSVEDGMKLANSTTKSMDKINEEVSSINEAISVIDQIAFQTNILSLNAAVEAATAGEAGKGFAVVAQEVRNLAARSAEAAKEIKDLVESATAKANDGKHIADEMIQGYTNLNEKISETISLIENVSTASKEQMQGIEQINDTVTMLDRVTQENASEANNVAQIASEVESMANKLVADAQKKQFN